MAAHRQNRPWTGSVQTVETPQVPEYDASCYLCPGNLRVSGEKNPTYNGIFIFDNDHPCVSTAAPANLANPPGIYKNKTASGIARVICYDDGHDKSLATIGPESVIELVRAWQTQYVELGQRPQVAHVLIFENRGELVGVSNPHPHGQIYATNFVFKTIEVEAEATRIHAKENGRILFQDILSSEKERGSGIIAENESAIAFIPYFSRYAYEVYVAPKATHSSVADLTDREVTDFAELLQNVVIRFDNLWNRPFPYVMVLHNAPCDDGDYEHFHFHVEFHPPLRKPDLLKYLAGPEIGGGNFLSDTNPDDKAEELRSASTTHYSIA